MNLRKSLAVLAAIGVSVGVFLAVGTASTAGPAPQPAPVSAELVELGTRAIGPDATQAVRCPGYNTAVSTTREAGVKETRPPEDITAAMLKILAVPDKAHRDVAYQAFSSGVEVQRHVVASLDGQPVAVIVLTDTGDGLGVDFAIACVA